MADLDKRLTPAKATSFEVYLNGTPLGAGAFKHINEDHGMVVGNDTITSRREHWPLFGLICDCHSYRSVGKGTWNEWSCRHAPFLYSTLQADADRLIDVTIRLKKGQKPKRLIF